MRHIDRLPEPEILVRKHEVWQQQFDKGRTVNPKLRPDSSKYGNKDIRKTLDACSHYKCFYCEGRKQLTESEKQSLLLYAQHDQPYSLMSEVFLKKHFPNLFA